MSDPIDRMDTLKAIEDYFNPNHNVDELPELLTEFLIAVGVIISSQPPAQPEPTRIISETRAIPSDDDCVSLSETVTATYYDEENEEWLRKSVTIRDVLDSVCDEYTVLPSAQLERDIPLDYIIDEEGNAICPKCGANVEWHKYCEECGQALKWKEEIN